jgi:hypothetical protein
MARLRPAFWRKRWPGAWAVPAALADMAARPLDECLLRKGLLLHLGRSMAVRFASTRVQTPLR